MCFTVRKINIILSLLLVVVCSWGQVTDAKNFTITPQTVVKTNLPKQGSRDAQLGTYDGDCYGVGQIWDV